MLEKAIQIVDSLGGKQKAKRDREHDEGLFSTLSEIVDSDDVSDLCSSLCGSCEYYSSQFQPLLDAVEFIENDDNEFILADIEEKACEFAESVDELWKSVQKAVLPHRVQDDEGDSRYTFYYKYFDREVDDVETADEQFREDREEITSLCSDVKENCRSLRSQVREALAK